VKNRIFTNGVITMLAVMNIASVSFIVLIVVVLLGVVLYEVGLLHTEAENAGIPFHTFIKNLFKF